MNVAETIVNYNIESIKLAKPGDQYKLIFLKDFEIHIVDFFFSLFIFSKSLFR